MKYLLYQLEYRRWLMIAILAALIIHLLPAPPQLSGDAKSILAITVMTVLLVLFEPVPLPVVALLIIILEVFFGVAPTRTVAQSFMSDSVIFIAGSLMLAVAVVKQQLDKRILLFILGLTRSSVHRTLFLLVALSALMASVMGEHAVAAIMLPVALVLIRACQKVGGAVGRLRGIFLMAVAYGSAVAAVGTPSGGARNAIMINYWESLSGIQVAYPEWTISLYPMVLVQVPILYFVLNRVYRPEPGELAAAYEDLHQEISAQPRLRDEDWITIGIILFTLLLWILYSQEVGLGPIALVGVVLCIVTGVLNWEDINHDLNWGIIILYASVISLGLWMDETGAADYLAGGMQFLLGYLGIEGGIGLIIAVSLVGMLVGSILSTGPAIAILGPIVLRQAELTGSSPLVLGMVMVTSTSYANFTPLSSPACTIIYGSEMVGRREFFKMGSWMAAISLVIIVLFAHFYWPWLMSL